MEQYVGMDVSLKETSICVVDGSGKVLCEGTVISDPAAIAEFIEGAAADAVRIGLETGPTTTWLWHELRAVGRKNQICGASLRSDCPFYLFHPPSRPTGLARASRTPVHWALQLTSVENSRISAADRINRRDWGAWNK